MIIIPASLQAVGYAPDDEVIFQCCFCGQTCGLAKPVYRKQWLSGQIKYKRELQRLDEVKLEEAK